MIEEASLFRDSRCRRSCHADQTPIVIRSEIFSRHGWRGPQHWGVPQGRDRLFTGRPRGRGLLHPERQGEGLRRFGATQGSGRRNAWNERFLWGGMSCRAGAAHSDGLDDDGLRHRAPGKKRLLSA